MHLPNNFVKKHVNLKAVFANVFNCKPCGMRQALDKINLPLIGTHHRGIDDAHNIAQIAKVLIQGGAL